MRVVTLKESREKAKQEWKDYVIACRQHNDRFLKEAKSVYNHIKNGKRIIDIYATFKEAGVNPNGEPKIAIALACDRGVLFKKRNNGSGKFESDDDRNNIWLPQRTFPEWPKEDKDGYRNILNESIKTRVPTIPAKYIPRGKLKKYWVLWEAKDWQEVPKDPLLLKRLSDNLFVVLAGWNMTRIERAICEGR